ncbi:aldo/keto reductase [Tissierella creatinophila]|uniref:General stress protein 69 n=1 Tax=Tissierella creatinophila DSM 6911 TaxID=1123403 RepID=A0A1U7M6N5_TISCR|nr:aldo/keto reductase [Tissierella creatinophila]OLS02982.1 general stress protein 69 [Tissierella creatinophila DSM 6911]
MEKRILGKTDFEVSVVGFGGIPAQRLDKEQVLELLTEAYNQGMNFIDTARAYTASEALIGYALEKLGRDKFYLATKSMSRTYKGIIDEFNLSLSLLRTDYIDLYQFHNVKTFEEYDEIMSDDGAYRAVKELKEQGKIREIGITSHSKEILDMAVDTNFFNTIQYPYNAVENQGEELFKKAKASNIGVIVMKPLAGGAISKGELAIRYILDNPNISVVIPGMESMEQIIQNSRAGIDRREMTEEEKEMLAKEASTLGAEFCRRCGYCLPCPQGIDIPTNFLMEGYYTRYDLKDWARSRYEAISPKANNCIECGLCETKCPYDLPIIKMLKNVVKVFE